MTPYHFDEEDQPYWEYCLQCGVMMDEETDHYLCPRCYQACTGPLAGAERFTVQPSSAHPGSSSLLVIQVHESKIATSEKRVEDWQIIVNQWRNEHSLRD